MSMERVKRGPERLESRCNVRSKCDLGSPSLVVITNMEPMKLDIYWSLKRQKDFRNTQLFIFLRGLDKLPPIDIERVVEYIENYDPEDGSSVIRGVLIGIDENILHKVFHLSIGELEVGRDMSNDFRPRIYFKGGMSSLEQNQGWKEHWKAWYSIGQLMWPQGYMQKWELSGRRGSLLYYYVPIL
uniref:Predicted protein n=1 Tax=Physcomitrium patens TaxID=3218 RepID=A9U3C6_PHYPA